jgi:glycosyltransferase involved in cell wall biosynthesis
MRVLHIVATDQRRGAEIFAEDLRRVLDGIGIDQMSMVLSRDGGISDLRRVWRSFRPQLLQAHGGSALKHAVLAATGTPIVYRRIGGAHPSLRRPLRRRLFGALMRRADRVVTVADYVREETLTLFRLSPECVVTIPNGVDPVRMRPGTSRGSIRELLGIPSDAAVLLSIGALVREKDPSSHLEVSRRVLEVRRDAFHLIVGDGPLRGTAEDENRAKANGDRVRFLGVRSDVADLLSAADVVLFASRPDGMEGMPAVLIEAGMCGAPVAGFDVAGAGEVVVDGVTGRLVPWPDHDALARVVLELFDRDGSMGAAARVRCLREFSIEPIAKQYMGVYESVLSR